MKFQLGLPALIFFFVVPLHAQHGGHSGGHGGGGHAGFGGHSNHGTIHAISGHSAVHAGSSGAHGPSPVVPSHNNFPGGQGFHSDFLAPHAGFVGHTGFGPGHDHFGFDHHWFPHHHLHHIHHGHFFGAPFFPPFFFTTGGWVNPIAVVPPPVIPPPLPSPLILLVFKDHSIYAVTDYWLENGQVYYVTSQGDQYSVPVEQIDFDMTLQLNQERGVPFLLERRPPP